MRPRSKQIIIKAINNPYLTLFNAAKIIRIGAVLQARRGTERYAKLKGGITIIIKRFPPTFYTHFIQQ